MSKTIHGEEKTVRKTFGKRLTPIAAITAPAEKKGYIDGKKNRRKDYSGGRSDGLG